METETSVTGWIGALRSRADESAAGKLWQRYFDRLVPRIRGRLNRGAARVSDEEDVALSAIDTLVRGLSAGRYPDLHDRDGLWALLLTIAERRATRHREREMTQKRGGGHVLDEAAIRGRSGDSQAPGIDQFADQGPSPDFAALVADEVESRVAALSDPVLREIALLELEGYAPLEIQQAIGVGSVRTVHRKRKLIRTIWEQQDVDSPPTGV